MKNEYFSDTDVSSKRADFELGQKSIWTFTDPGPNRIPGTCHSEVILENEPDFGYVTKSIGGKEKSYPAEAKEVFLFDEKFNTSWIGTYEDNNIRNYETCNKYDYYEAFTEQHQGNFSNSCNQKNHFLRTYDC